MVDINKLELVQTKVREILHRTREEATGFKELGAECGVFEVTEEGSIDEGAVFILNGQEFVMEDESSAYLETPNEEELFRNYERETDRILEAAGVEFDKLPKEKQVEALKLVASVAGNVVAQINAGLGQDWFAKVQSAFEELEKEIPGFSYDDWQELDIEFVIDGEKYSMAAWNESELCTDTYPRKTIEELKNERS